MPSMVHVMLVQAVVLQFPKYKPNQKNPGKIDWEKLKGHPSEIKEMLNKTNVSIGSTITVETSRQSKYSREESGSAE